jgi:hypothetical protein
MSSRSWKASKKRRNEGQKESRILVENGLLVLRRLKRRNSQFLRRRKCPLL